MLTVETDLISHRMALLVNKVGSRVLSSVKKKREKKERKWVGASGGKGYGIGRVNV